MKSRGKSRIGVDSNMAAIRSMQKKITSIVDKYAEFWPKNNFFWTRFNKIEVFFVWAPESTKTIVSTENKRKEEITRYIKTY
jgi:hypothetical protein